MLFSSFLSIETLQAKQKTRGLKSLVSPLVNEQNQSNGFIANPGAN
jgi:hypothetical protein